MTIDVSALGPQDLSAMEDLNDLFAEVFADPISFQSRRPRPAYLRALLASDTFIALVARQDGHLVGGLAAYELKKYEQERSEIYIYDLAVRASHRRRGVATALIEALRALAAARGAWVVFVQADTAPEDAPAIALYTKLGRREDVLHFDIEVGNGQNLHEIVPASAKKD